MTIGVEQHARTPFREEVWRQLAEGFRFVSGNFDETVFDDPDEFRIDRDPNPHLGFGIGTHYCLGANLARAEISVVFTELLSRLRDIRAVDPTAIDRGDSSLVLAMKHLPAVFTPESRT